MCENECEKRHYQLLTIVHGFGRHTIVCRFSWFWRISKNDENHEKKPTIAHGVVRHTIVCRFSSFWWLSKCDKNHEKNMDYSP